MEHVIGTKQVILNFSELFCKNEVEVLNSTCFKEVWSHFLDHIYKIQKQDVLKILNICPEPKKDFIILFKLLFEFNVADIKKINPFFKMILDHRDVLFELIENFYDYWRRLERYGMVYAKSNFVGIESTTFTNAMDRFNTIILSTYRSISQKVFGEEFPIYRALPAGVNAAILIAKHRWMAKDSCYAFLASAHVIEQILIRPPFITYSAKNKRTGTYEEVFENPLQQIGKKYAFEEYYCYQAHVGSALAYVYFHRDYLSHGITLCNLFDFVPLHKCQGQKPDILYVFGADIQGDSVFYHDVENDLYIGVAPHNSSIDYFGYMKKMLLTLYNVKMIDNGYLPLHGACVNIKLRNGKEKNIVIIGDSGAGKSESLEALSEVAGDDISSQVVVFDDMGTFKTNGNQVMAYGSEIGAFVRLDDMKAGYAYKEMDRAIFMNPDKLNSRLVVPVSTYSQIMKGYPVDMVLYANNYDDVDEPLSFFNTKEEALKIFVRGARKAKGTTQEVGLVESFFANPFGPHQRQKQTEKLLDRYFEQLFENHVAVGELYTKLAIAGYEQKGPEEAARKLFEQLEK
ncbi:MAG TPA: phosphoenolpyruvate carboxykinase [Candidatus Pelethenecus faecipullorum]|uniref:Phosphoenolpyruvate carboxykinase n=1 Tax=Candidatus Pelethenecus faecipullorum TaxID=2840900 RepID=A0A9D1GSC4_9MOLU|nr:phosphoenolpyruvate carboxykinase [Candidatus Pelethenecus faecipullorum]